MCLIFLVIDHIFFRMLLTKFQWSLFFNLFGHFMLCVVVLLHSGLAVHNCCVSCVCSISAQFADVAFCLKKWLVRKANCRVRFCHGRAFV